MSQPPDGFRDLGAARGKPEQLPPGFTPSAERVPQTPPKSNAVKWLVLTVVVLLVLSIAVGVTFFVT